MKTFLVTILVVLLASVAGIFISGQSGKVFENMAVVGRNFASVFFVDSVTVSGLQGTYTNASSARKVNILIVPGHEPGDGGTSFNGLNERDVNVDLAEKLAYYLRTNWHYNVTIARTKDAWNPTLQNYFDQNWDSIKQFAKDKKTEMSQMMSNGTVSKAVGGIVHNAASADTALRIYGINKWANENNIDITINIHLNDYPRRNTNVAGEYKGFSIYIPDVQYSNAKATAPIAYDIFKRLSAVTTVSNLPKENAGIVSDQNLIAVGAKNTLDSASMLIEYGYIYEPWFQDIFARSVIINKMTYGTYLGIQDFFGSYDRATLSRN